MPFKRRRENRTDYKQRLAMLRSGRPRLAIRRNLNNFHAQIIVFDEAGDKVVAEVFSKSLRKLGWKGHGGNISSAYLTGLLIGIEAKKNGVNEAIVDLGLQTSIKGASLYAVAQGAKDAGLKIPMGAMTDKDRISGKHVARYAAALKKDQDKYKKQFSAYIKNGLDPEKLPEHFEEIKKKLLASAPKQVVTASGETEEDGDNEKWEDVS